MQPTAARTEDRESNADCLHVLDMPQLYQRPTSEAMIRALNLLAVDAPSFSSQADIRNHRRPAVDSIGVPEYLTRIVASPLTWIGHEETRDEIWELAGRRLTERSGRSGMSAFSRTFSIPLSSLQTKEISIHEPALTSDNLGLKTWGSAYVLARNLHRLGIDHLLSQHHVQKSHEEVTSPPQVLELGSGTGLVGLAAAAAWNTHVLLTDLPAIVPNLRHNCALNTEPLELSSCRISTAVLDWSQPDATVQVSDGRTGARYDLSPQAYKFHVVIAADPIYDPAHPGMLAAVIGEWVERDSNRDGVRVLVAYPLRDAYEPQIDELRQRLSGIGLVLVDQAREIGLDDWKDEVVVEWAIWAWRDA